MRIVLKSRRDEPPLLNHRKSSHLLSMSMGLDFTSDPRRKDISSLPPTFTTAKHTLTLRFDDTPIEDVLSDEEMQILADYATGENKGEDHGR